MAKTAEQVLRDPVVEAEAARAAFAEPARARQAAEAAQRAADETQQRDALARWQQAVREQRAGLARAYERVMRAAAGPECTAQARADFLAPEAVPVVNEVLAQLQVVGRLLAGLAAVDRVGADPAALEGDAAVLRSLEAERLPATRRAL